MSADSTVLFTCPSCGAQTAYAPGTTVIRCPSCGAEQQIDDASGVIVEHSYDDWAALPEKPVATIANLVLHCQGCGASVESDKLADTCQFCGGVLIAQTQPEGLIVPEAVVPFGVEKQAADRAVVRWLGSRHFAPTALKKVGSIEALKGTYIPHWTFDARTATDYTGSRGENYVDTETYTVSDGQGGTRTETRAVERTRWYPAAGHVARGFDDVLVPASTQLPPKRLATMGPWALEAARDYVPQYLAGYSALRYDIDPDDGLVSARAEMEEVIRRDCVADIGGDRQQVLTMNVRYSANMFKLILLPLWIASYLYNGKTFQVLVNANTGEVVGDRPYSRLKITFAVLVGLLIAAVVIFLLSRHSTPASAAALE